MKALHRQKLQELGITSTKYCNQPSIDDPDWEEKMPDLAIWGITLEGPRGSMFVDHTPRGHGGDGRYHLRTVQYDPSSEVNSYPTQREAIAGYISRVYHV